MKRILILALLVLVVGCEKKLSEYGQKAAALKAECERLTQETDKVYEPIIGRFLDSESHGIQISGINGSALNHYMYFQKEDKKAKVAYVMKASFENKGYIQEVYKSLNIQQPGVDTEAHFGICGWKNNADMYIADIENLRVIGKPN